MGAARGAEIADRFEIVGREHFETARARGKGVFVLTGHYGCWELAGYPLGRWLGTLYIVARPQNNPYIAAHFERLRESNGNVQIDRDRAGTRMLKVLKKGGAIGVAIDQRVRPSQALLVPFLGRYAWTSRLPAYLATVTGCAAVPMVCVPLPDGRYRMTFDQPILPEGEGDDEIERLTRRYAAALEPHIRARPELWLWMHSRWQRTRKQRRPEAIARLIEESGLPQARPLHDLARRAPASSPIERLGALATDDFVENARHLLLVSPGERAGSGAAAAFAGAVVRLGHATRYIDAARALRSSRSRARRRSPRRRAARSRSDPAGGDRRRRTGRSRSGAARSLRSLPAAPPGSGLGGPRRRRCRDLAASGASRCLGGRGAIDAFLDACEVVDLLRSRRGSVRHGGLGAGASDGERRPRGRAVLGANNERAEGVVTTTPGARAVRA